MRSSVVLSLLILLACGCNRNEPMTKLLNEQKLLKDSAGNLNDSIGSFIQKGDSINAKARQKDLGAVFARLTAIQSSIDSLEKMK